MKSAFHDHFSAVSDTYAQYRPHYPQALFDYLASLTPRHDCAWDCATGSGQAAPPWRCTARNPANDSRP